MEKFQLARQDGESDRAIFFLEKALQTPEYRSEALIWKGIGAMQQQQLHQAFLFLSSAAAWLPKRADIQALTGRVVLALGKPVLATQLLKAAWKQNPTDAALRSMLWQARSRTESPEKLRKLILALLPEINDAQELQLIAGLLAKQAGASSFLGVAQYDAERCEVSGWAINLKSPESHVRVAVHSQDERHECVAEHPHPFLTHSGLCLDHGAFRLQIKDPAKTLHVRFEDGTALSGSPLSNLPVFVPPAAVGENAARLEPVDVLVPVYDGLEETLECVHSVLRSREFNRTVHRLVVMNDATPNPTLRQALRDLAAAGEIEHVEHATNLGFIRNVNRGMALSPERDVVWLNADTRVHGNWLDRLRAVAYSAKDIASVTPFTNNGELMSFPVSRVSHTMPTAREQAGLDELARVTDSPAVEIETGCGFCLYIKRDAIDEAGYLDEVHLLRGYGEETDWCLRARSLGWRHMGAPNVFVAHQGGISFGDEKSLRVAHNNGILKRRYPNASARYQDFCMRDPLKLPRQALQRARLEQLAASMANASASARPPNGLRQLHIHKGASFKTPLGLTWHFEGSHTVVTLQAELQPLLLSLEYRLPAEAGDLINDLRKLPLDEIVYRQLTACPKELVALAATLEKPYRILCQDDELLDQAASRDWCEFAGRATSVVVPWKTLRARYADALPNANITVDSKKTRNARPNKKAPRVLLIADELRNAEVAGQWIDLARRLTRERLNVMLIALGDGPWLKALLATGAVHALPEVQGLDQAECLNLVDCQGALSLDKDPGAGWKAPELATMLGLPLYAVPGSVSRDAGALPINQLSLSLSRA
ncbi:glycosyltransferase [Pseudomonas sp. CFBP 13711]|uniref:glycosyltransferase family 2 protein n=1 Tax=unclassified Pseudomonas TaxID=196821 RepID=UPI001785E8B0|nr:MULTISPECIES: glycosyltransferase family 2 protein [unclassified Pseudomonas]MBD8708426.1 glycosyltransferase [Pseudomonas sp. CFBP 13711]MBD8714907.1 glycosyltransferase [Pseudomonas sp. CFBP 13715]